jgi:HD superfamily phosphodiesterase
LTAHNWEHISRDTLNAIVIGEAEGADKLPEYLEAAAISYSADEIAKQASCIRTHKGSMFDTHPVGLEAKVVADADLLEKFGAFGIYQAIRSWGEFDWPLARIIGFANRETPLTLETETGKHLAEPGRQLVVDFFRELRRAAEPYGDSSL